MSQYSQITDKFKKIEHDNSNLLRPYQALLSGIQSFNGEIPGIKNLRVKVNENDIDLSFIGLKFKIEYQYLLKEETSYGQLCLFLEQEDGKKILKEKETFDRAGNFKIDNEVFSTTEEIECVAVVLNMVHRAIRS